MELDMGVGDEVPPIDETALFLSSFGLNPYIIADFCLEPILEKYFGKSLSC